MMVGLAPGVGVRCLRSLGLPCLFGPDVNGDGRVSGADYALLDQMNRGAGGGRSGGSGPRKDGGSGCLLFFVGFALALLLVALARG